MFLSGKHNRVLTHENEAFTVWLKIKNYNVSVLWEISVFLSSSSVDQLHVLQLCFCAQCPLSGHNPCLCARAAAPYRKSRCCRHWLILLPDSWLDPGTVVMDSEAGEHISQLNAAKWFGGLSLPESGCELCVQHWTGLLPACYQNSHTAQEMDDLSSQCARGFNAKLNINDIMGLYLALQLSLGLWSTHRAHWSWSWK